MCHLVSEGKKVAKEEYKTRRHDNVSKTLHWKLCELTNWRGRKKWCCEGHVENIITSLKQEDLTPF